jgi:rRNA maturation endonuclease Nob1
MKTRHAQQDQSKFHKKTVNKAVRICVNCGNIAVRIENHGVFCKDCGSFFDVEKENNE